MSDVTRILLQIESGDPSEADKLLPLVYQELRQLAAARLAKEKPGQTLQPTILVHEAYLRLVNVDQPQQWNGRGHFFAAAAEAMRRIIIDRARYKRRLKRHGVIEQADIDQLAEDSSVSNIDLIALDEALTEFERQWPEKANLVKLRYFAGLTTAEAAQTMGISLRTAERTWAYSKAWLLKAIGDE